MITPSFSIEQEDNYLIFTIRAPYAKIGDTEIEYADNMFLFSSKPYYLRVHLPADVLYDETGSAKYDVDKGEFVVRVPKKTKGEYFPRLDMITELLRPQKDPSAKPLVEEMEGDDGDEEFDDEEGDEYLLEQKLTDMSKSDTIPDETSLYGYGFGWKRTGVLEELRSSIGKLIDLNEPEIISIEQRAEECAKYDNIKFDPERYLADNLDAEEQLLRIIQLPFNANLKITEEDRERLKDLPARKLPKLSPSDNLKLGYSLLDIIYAYAYDQRVNEWEDSSESGWTIAKLSPSLSFLCRFSSAEQSLTSAVRRALCYPLYRNWHLSQIVIEDMKKIFKEGRSALLHILSSIHSIFVSSSEFRYLLNDLYLTDYCIWIQSVDEEILIELTQQLQNVQVSKSDVDLNLEELEVEGRLAMMRVDNGLDSDDDEES